MQRTSCLLLLLGILSSVRGQNAYIPPDFYGDAADDKAGFVANGGQVADLNGNPVNDVSYYSLGGAPRVYARKESILSFVVASVDTTSTMDTLRRLDMRPIGENVQWVDPTEYEMKNQVQSFYLPHCPPAGVEQMHLYNRLVYEEVYPYTDLHLYTGKNGGQKMSIVLRSGADPHDIQFQFFGHDSMHIDVAGLLKLYMQGSFIVLPAAVAYQVDANDNIIPLGWGGTWEEEFGIASLYFGTYDPSLPLVLQIQAPPMIDPPQENGLCWSTYFGGDNRDFPEACEVDQFGNFYVTSRTFSTYASFPGIPGQNIFSGASSVLVAKFDAAQNIEWMDFIAGSTNSGPRALTVRKTNPADVFVSAWVNSDDFYLEPDATAFFEPNADSNGPNGALCRFDAVTGALEWSTYFISEGFVEGITVDDNDRLLAVGVSSTDNLPVNQVPAPPNAEQWAYSGEEDAFIAMFNTNEELMWSTYTGGPDVDWLLSVTSLRNRIVAAGYTYSDSVHVLDGGPTAYDQVVRAGGNDLFIMEFDTNGVQLWGTFFGGSGTEHMLHRNHALAIAPLSSDVYMVGQTNSADLPYVSGGGWSDTTYTGSTEGFIARFRGADRAPVWITYVGDTGFTSVTSVAVLKNDEPVVAGLTNDGTVPVVPVWALYSNPNLLGINDGFVMSFDADQELQWSTFYGGENPLQGDRIVDIVNIDNDLLYATGYTGADWDQGQFFPFRDPGNGAFYDFDFDFDVDGFNALFCISEAFTAVQDVSGRAAPFGVHWGAGQLTLTGLVERMVDMRIHDALGQLVAQRTCPVQNGTASISTGQLAPAGYVVQVLNIGSRTFVVQP